MASTIANYQGNGSTTDFNVPFDYLAKKFVKVTVDSREKLGGDYGDTTKDYFFVDKTTIRFNTAPASGTEIIIRRYTSATDRIVSFKDASVLKASDLDISSVQTIHIAEEGRDVINDALIVDREGNWDAKGKRITNVGAPVADSDAVTYGVYKADAMGANQSKLDAEKARDRAIEAETNAKESEKVVTDIAEILVPIAPEVKIVADNIDHVVTDSNNIDKINIVGTDLSGSLSDTIVEDYGDLGNPGGSLPTITGGNIKIVADNIDDVRTVAGLAPEFDTVVNSVDTVTKLTTRAETAATKAESSATNSANSAKTATAQATEATKQATLAKTSADKAALSKDAAKVSETNAKVSETNAKASETEATAQADRAKGYADQAASCQINSDWAETDSTSKTFIKNKPTLGALASKDSIAYSEITGTPPEQDLSGLATKKELQTGLASKANTKHTHTVAEITNLNSTLSGYVTTATLTAELAKKANASHTHTTAQVTGLDTALAGKAPVSHTHTVSQITDLTTTLAPYAKTTDVNSKLSAKADTTAVNAGLAKKLDITTFNGFVDYGDLGS